MPKYYDFMICGYYLYFTSHCIIREFIKTNYKEMYLKWSSMSKEGFYQG